MTTNRAMPVPAYRVTSIIPEDDISNPARIVPAHRIYFTADNGVSSSVLVANTELSDVATVQAKIEGAILNLSQIMGLGGK